MDALIKKYKKELPQIEAHWDLSDDAINHNDINDNIKANGLIISSALLNAYLKAYISLKFIMQIHYGLKNTTIQKLPGSFVRGSIKINFLPFFL